MAALPAAASADGLIDALQVRQDTFANFFSSKSTDTATGTTTRINVDNYLSRSVYQLNYNLLPTLNVNAGGTTERSLTSVSGDVDDSETLGTRFRPYLWLTLRDPVFGATVGYELSEDKSSPDRAQALTLSRESYTGGLSWKPVDLPFTHLRYIRNTTTDNARQTLDTQEDQLFLRSEYAWRGFSAAYAGSHLDTLDRIREATTTQTSHDGRLLYAVRLLEGRVSLSTEHRLRHTEITFDKAAGPTSSTLLAVAAAAGLSAIDESPETDPLAANAALNDDVTTGDAGVNIGASQSGGARRNVGLDFGAGTTPTVTTLRVWVDQELTATASGSFSWEIYTSANGTDWSFHARVDGAPFGPFDRRFEISFPAVATRFIKAVTRPLSAANPDAAQFPNIAVTEVDAFVDRATASARGRANAPIVTTNRSHTFDATVVLMRAPSLHYRFAADYSVAETEGAAFAVPARYAFTNGLFFTHRFHPLLATSANTTVEVGSEQGASRTGITYAASLAATPLKTLTDSLVWSGNRVSTAGTTTTTNSLVFYNTAQLYQGLDATANAGITFVSDDGAGGSAERTQRYVTLGASTVPHPALTVTAYYTGRQTESSGSSVTTASDATEQQVDVGVLFSPFRTLSLSAAVGIVARTDEERRTTQNYGVNWNPFPDGTLLLSVSYNENRLTEDATSRTLQPSLRWYLTARRRTYLEATYQMATTTSSTVTVESRSFNAALSVPF